MVIAVDKKERKKMIDITDVNLVDFAKMVYELSSPQGLGFLHFTPNPLTDAEAEDLVATFKKDKICALYMDYVNGRACKMSVSRAEDGKLTIPDNWYDHTDRIYQQLLSHFNIQRPEGKKHGCACACIDCQSTKIES